MTIREIYEQYGLNVKFSMPNGPVCFLKEYQNGKFTIFTEGFGELFVIPNDFYDDYEIITK
jgi:hypothetical protein